ncbi:MAG: OmpH family outer membrane protein [Flammeovirgaceae bacterium]|nr:OmpH family outer membrane protein [Flammeovirgaceae bacterium]MDW8287234.1 OmpH family outer membrane protein [Flammeovirgaceae bacterium]
MKQLLFYCTLALLIASFSCQEKTGETNATALVATPRYAYVNIDTLLLYYKFYDAISADYREKRAKSDKQLQTRYAKLQEEFINTQKRAQAGLMSQNDIAKAEEDLAKKQQELQMLQNSLQEGLLAEEQNLMKQLNDRLLNYLKKYNEDKKYDLIFSYGAGSPILIASESLDITQVILDGLNAEYEEELKKKAQEKKEEKEKKK